MFNLCSCLSCTNGEIMSRNFRNDEKKEFLNNDKNFILRHKSFCLTCSFDAGMPGYLGILARNCNAGAVVVPEEGFNLFPRDGDGGLHVSDPALRLDVIVQLAWLHRRGVALEIDGQGVSHAAVQHGRSVLDQKGVLRLLQEDRQTRVVQIDPGSVHGTQKVRFYAG